MMTLRRTLAGIAAHEDLNFLLTNRIPRRLATRFVGWFSRIEQPQVRDLSIWLWRLFAELDLSDATKGSFASLHDCFIRELKPGARPVDPDPAILTSPCDAIVGACGQVSGTEVLQIKGFPYDLADLLHDPALVEHHRGGSYITLRLTSAMYHRFHAPHDLRVEAFSYVSGDTWNVNPIALKRIERLFCKNERAVIRARLAPDGPLLTLVPVAAILVASLRLKFLGEHIDPRRLGPRLVPCDAAFAKGEEMGHFQHGSTIVVLAPVGLALCPNIQEGIRIRVGEPMMRLIGRLPASTTEMDNGLPTRKAISQEVEPASSSG